MQLRTVGTALAVLAGTMVYVSLSPAAPANSGQAGAAGLGISSGTATAVNRASTTTRGIVGHSINVVFPVVALNSLAGKEGFAEDVEYGEQVKAIRFFVRQINQSGGINGRKINAMVDTFDPTNDAAMRAQCEDWTKGNPAAFAVLDGIGTWQGDNQLCVTKEGHTPLLSQWTTVSNWTTEGAPYLWWTGPSQDAVLQALVNWGLSSGM
jgi:hypothetical protein